VGVVGSALYRSGAMGSEHQYDPYAKSCLILAVCGTFTLPDRSLAVHVTAGVLSVKSPQPVATFVSAERTQRNKDRQFFKETAAVRFSNIRAVTDWASWRYMKRHYVPSLYDQNECYLRSFGRPIIEANSTRSKSHRPKAFFVDQYKTRSY
jgi:hypothetical protein